MTTVENKLKQEME